MIRLRKYILINSLILITNIALSQDTIRYIGFLDKLIYESIDLYPDNTFKWTSEYDLSWSEFGYYKINKDTLQLDFYGNLIIRQENKIPQKTNRYLIETKKLYLLNDNNRPIKRKKDKSIKTNWSWLYCGRYDYYFLKQD